MNLGSASYTFVCFKCKYTRKAISWHCPKCPHCREYLVGCGTRFKTPKARDVKGWKYAAVWAHKNGWLR